MKELYFAPHPDDEILGCGGTMAKHIKNGDEVYVCVVTKGVEPLFNKNVIEQTRAEQRSAHEYLGVKETVYLDFPAVMLEEEHRYIINQRILEVVDRIKPDNVYIPHFGDMQKDHAIVSESVLVAVRPKYAFKVKRVYSYETLSETEWNIPHVTNAFLPNYYIDISDTLSDKLNALAKFQSQISDFPNPRSLEAAEALAKLRGSTILTSAAEAFCLVREIG